MKQVPNPNVDLELDELDLEECIGRGGHGAVYKVRRSGATSRLLASAWHPTLCMGMVEHDAEAVRSAHCWAVRLQN